MADQLLYYPPWDILPGDPECKAKMGQFYDVCTSKAAHSCESWPEFIYHVEDVKLRIARLDAAVCSVQTITIGIYGPNR